MAYWIFGTNVARIVVIRKLSPIILDILLPKDLFFLQIKLFNRRNTLLSPDSRFSCPMKLAERENFLISDHSSGARQVWYERGGDSLRHRQHFDEELLSDHRRVSLRSHCRIFACLQTFAVTFAKDFGTFAGEKWDVLWLQQRDESRSTSLVSYSFSLGEWNNQSPLIDRYLSPNSFVLWGECLR